MSASDRRDRVAVVTGSNRGLGRAIAIHLSRLGLHVVVTARNDHDAHRTADELCDGNAKVSAHQLDITDPASVGRAFADIAHDHGRLDILVNNAGIAIDRHAAAAAPDMENVAAAVNTNTLGTWRACAAALPYMRANRYGRIVNVTTHMATFGDLGKGSPAYRLSKVGVNALTVILADELRDDNILVNAASPGKVDTRLAYGKADQPPEAATETFVHLALLPDAGPTGKLYANGESIEW